MSETTVESFTQPKLITFAAGFLLKLIDEELYFSSDAILKGKLKFLSMVLNLLCKFENFSNIYEDFNKFLNNIETGVTRWEDEVFLNRLEKILFGKLQCLKGNINSNINSGSGSETQQDHLFDTVKHEKNDENDVYIKMEPDPSEDLEREPLLVVYGEVCPDSIFPHPTNETEDNFEVFDDSTPSIKLENETVEENEITSDFKANEDPIEGHEKTEVEDVDSSFDNMDPGFMDTSSTSHSESQYRSREYQTIKNELDRQCDNLMKPIYNSLFRKLWQCTECDYTAKTRHSVKEHVETHISRFSHQCPFCEKNCQYTKRT